MDKSFSKDIDLKPKITVIGVGGAGGNAVNNMIHLGLQGVKFLVANTDAQALSQSLVEKDNRIQLGISITQGLGAGAKPDVGRAAAQETLEEIINNLYGSNMVFITAGMGGGTGTGAAPIIAKSAKEVGILTVGVVTKPFHFEGKTRTKIAEEGICELQKYVDTLIIIPNQNLFRLATEKTTFSEAFRIADDVLYSGVRGVTDLMMMPGLINLDFSDIRTVMAEMGKAMMGTGEAEGEKRALAAAEIAISNPLLDDVSMKGARGILINITGGHDMTLFEVDEAANRIKEEVDEEANIIFGSTFDETLSGKIRISVVATGIGLVQEKRNLDKLDKKSAYLDHYLKPGSFKNTEKIMEYSYNNLDDENYSNSFSNRLQKDNSEKKLIPELSNSNKENEESSSPENEIISHKNQKRKAFFSFEKLSSMINPSIEKLPKAVKKDSTEEDIEKENNSDNNKGNIGKKIINENKAQRLDFLDIPAFLRRKNNHKE